MSQLQQLSIIINENTYFQFLPISDPVHSKVSDLDLDLVKTRLGFGQDSSDSIKTRSGLGQDSYRLRLSLGRVLTEFNK